MKWKSELFRHCLRARCVHHVTTFSQSYQVGLCNQRVFFPERQHHFHSPITMHCYSFWYKYCLPGWSAGKYCTLPFLCKKCFCTVSWIIYPQSATVGPFYVQILLVHTLCTNIVYSAASVFDAWVRRWLGRYWEHTDCLHARGLPARIPTPHRAPHCGLTRQELHLQQDPQSGGEMLTYDWVNSFILKERKKKKILPLSLFTVIWRQNLILAPSWSVTPPKRQVLGERVEVLYELSSC